LYTADCSQQYEAWWKALLSSEKAPYGDQVRCLQRVHARCLLEQELEKSCCMGRRRGTKSGSHEGYAEEPLRDLCHGLPGSGKSEVIKSLSGCARTSSRSGAGSMECTTCAWPQ
jgi:hypothetical protein